MLKKAITYQNMDGEDVTEDFYFHLTKAEVVEMEISAKGGEGLEHWLNVMIESKDGRELIDAFKNILLSCVGQRSPDGKEFIKNQQVRDYFVQTGAYSALFMELLSSTEQNGTEVVAEFLTQIVPKDIAQKIGTGQKLVEGVPQASTEEPAWVKESRDPTPDELKKMTPDQLRDAYLKKTSAQ